MKHVYYYENLQFVGEYIEEKGELQDAYRCIEISIQTPDGPAMMVHLIKIGTIYPQEDGLLGLLSTDSLLYQKHVQASSGLDLNHKEVPHIHKH